MKRLKIIIVALTGITMMQFSCSNDDDNEPIVTEPTLYKKWYFKETVINGVVEAYDGNEPCGKDYIEFYNTNQVKEVDIEDCEPVVYEWGSFTQSGNMLTIMDDSGSGESETFEIIELTETSFIVKHEEYYDEDEVIDVVEDRFTND